MTSQLSTSTDVDVEESNSDLKFKNLSAQHSLNRSNRQAHSDVRPQSQSGLCIVTLATRTGQPPWTYLNPKNTTTCLQQKQRESSNGFLPSVLWRQGWETSHSIHTSTQSRPSCRSSAEYCHRNKGWCNSGYFLVHHEDMGEQGGA